MENSELEKSIIALLKENARLSASEIAGRLNIPADSVEKVIASLESEKIICGYTAIVNSKTRAVFEINKGIGKIKNIEVNSKIPKELRRVQFDNMIYIADGPSDIPGRELQ